MSDAELLADAQAALHALLTGQQMVEVEYNGRRTRFTPATINTLRAYISELQARINGQCQRGAIGFIL